MDTYRPSLQSGPAPSHSGRAPRARADEAGAGCASFGERGLAGFFLGDAERFDWLAMML